MSLDDVSVQINGFCIGALPRQKPRQGGTDIILFRFTSQNFSVQSNGFLIPLRGLELLSLFA